MRGELIKATTTRTVLGYTLAGAALVLANVLIVTLSSDDLRTVADKREVIAGIPILLLLLGIVSAAGEYRHGTAASEALVARHGRGVQLLARAGAAALVGAAVAVPMVVLALGVGLPLLAGEPGRLPGSLEVAAVAGGSLLAAGWLAIIGVVAGALVRNQVAGVIGALILTFVVGPLLGSIDAGLVGYTPFGGAAILAGDPAGGDLPRSGAVLVLAAWTVLLTATALAVERRRDLA